MKLPFGQIPPGTFDAAFPKSPTTGLPAMHQGVETQARRMMAPPPMINTTASDKVAALGAAGPAPMTSAPPPASMMMMAPRQAPVNPLGGMDSRPLSERSSAGPMSYAPRGVGTNNPNSYAVGRNNKDFAMRTGQAPMMMQPGQGPRGQAPMMLGGFVPPQSSNGLPAPAPGGPPSMMPAPGGGRDDAFWAEQSGLMNTFLGEQQKLGMDMELADQTAAAKIEERAQNTAQEIMGDMRKTARARETYPSIDPMTGEVNQRYYTSGNGMMVPRNQPEPPPLAPSVQMIPGTGIGIPMIGDKLIPGAPMMRQEENVGWSPKGQQPTKLSPMERPGTGKAPVTRTFPRKGADGQPEEVTMQWNEQRGGWEPVKFLDANGDGVDDRQPGQTAGSTKSGWSFQVKTI